MPKKTTPPPPASPSSSVPRSDANTDRVEPGDLGSQSAKRQKPTPPPRPEESRFENEGGATPQGQQIGGTPDPTVPQDPDAPPRDVNKSST